VVSAYTKDNSPTATMKLLKDSDVLYADKDKTTSLLHSVGFQYAYSVEQSGYIGNVSYGHNYVNVSGKNSLTYLPRPPSKNSFAPRPTATAKSLRWPRRMSVR